MSDTLEVDSIQKSFHNRQLLSDIYLKCQTGEVVGILGRNGCGKSTLLKIMFGTEPALNKGIRINGQMYTEPYKTRNLLAYLPQHSFLPASISLKRIVNICIADKDKRKNILENERISKHINKRIKELSGGELRYFEVLLLVNSEAKFVLLDEPFSGIEPLYSEKIRELIDDHKSAKGFIITDHDYRNIIATSTRIVLIDNGALKNITEVKQLEEFHYLPEGTFSQKADLEESNEVFENFGIDKQTLQDLEIFEHNRGGAIYAIFDKVKTLGARSILDKMLSSPLTDVSLLEARRDAICFFKEHKFVLHLDRTKIDFIEHYLSSGIPLLRRNTIDIIIQNIQSRLKPNNERYVIQSGVEYSIEFLQYLSTLVLELERANTPKHLSDIAFCIRGILEDKNFQDIIAPNKQFSSFHMAECDHWLRNKGKESLRTLLNIIYELDVFVTVAKAAESYNLTFAQYERNAPSEVTIHGLFHPLLQNPVENNFVMENNGNVCFLTGANMSGKSTFLKAFGVAVYLAHVGFPVPAREMKTTVFNGLITTINLSDNIKQGYSHFYSEVRRVKEAALLVQQKEKMIVIFDELFRGTNVKDAFDASLMITAAFSEIHHSMFLVSTHIIEIADELEKRPNIFFNCFESTLEGETPVYSYKIKTGVSKERLGMQIVKNEGILEILSNKKIIK